MLRWQDFCDHREEFMPVLLNHYEWTCSKKGSAMTQQASRCFFYQNNRSTVGLLQHLVYSWMCPFWSVESKHWIKPLCAVLVNLRSAGVNAKLKNRKQGRDPRGTSTPPAMHKMSSHPPQPQLVLVINTSWLAVTANCQSLHKRNTQKVLFQCQSC